MLEETLPRRKMALGKGWSEGREEEGCVGSLCVGCEDRRAKTGCQSDHTQSPLSLDDFTAHLHARPCYMKSPAAETKDELP